MKYLLILVAAILSVNSVSAQEEPHTITNSCYARQNGTFARDLNSCRHYWYCKEDRGVRGECGNNLTFDAEINYCVQQHNQNCFRCPPKGYYTESVPHACRQFMECWNGNFRLRVCPTGLVYDGRNEVRQCNSPPSSGGCYREVRLEDDEDRPLCPQSDNATPIFLPDPTDCSIYFVCTGGVRAERRRCASGLHINIRSRICDRPERAECYPAPTTTPRPPATTTTPAPPSPGPALRCPINEPASLVPSRISCQHYYVCLRDGSYHQEDCGVGRIFDHIHRNCTNPENGECWSETHPPERGTEQTLLYQLNGDLQQPMADDFYNDDN